MLANFFIDLLAALVLSKHFLFFLFRNKLRNRVLWRECGNFQTISWDSIFKSLVTLVEALQKVKGLQFSLTKGLFYVSSIFTFVIIYLLVLFYLFCEIGKMDPK